MMRFAPALSGLLCVTGLVAPRGVEAQVVQGRIVDDVNLTPVAYASVVLLDRNRGAVLVRSADSDGRYSLEIPGPGEYFLSVEGLGYAPVESPLFLIPDSAAYEVDFELTATPFALEGFDVSVRNERVVDHLTTVLRQNPHAMSGFRVIQGARLEDAKRGAVDNTDLLRRLFIVVSHGRDVCIGVDKMQPLRARGSFDRHDAPAVRRIAEGQCGALFVDDYQCRNELLEQIDLTQIAVVVAFRGMVRMYSRDFHWSTRRPHPSC